MPTGPAAEPLPLDVAQRLTDFARACKGATRSVTLYPDGHPAIVGGLSRLVEASSRAMAHGPLVISVTPVSLAIDGRSAARPDAAIGELATLLHDHLVGELRVVGAGDPAVWRTFLLLLARPVDRLLVSGGISRMWMATGGQHVTVTEIDYAEVLRERTSGTDAAWDSIVKCCLEGQATDLDEETMNALVEIAGDQPRLSTWSGRSIRKPPKAAAAAPRPRRWCACCGSWRSRLSKRPPINSRPSFATRPARAGQLSPDVMLELLAERQRQPGTEMDVVSEVVDRMSDATISTFVASAVVSERGATARLAQAFQTLVPDDERQDALLGLIQSELRQTPIGREASFEELWQRASEMLLSYRDEKFVSAEYARELSTPGHRPSTWNAPATIRRSGSRHGWRRFRRSKFENSTSACCSTCCGSKRTRGAGAMCWIRRCRTWTTWSCSATSRRRCRWSRRLPPKPATRADPIVAPWPVPRSTSWPRDPCLVDGQPSTDRG